MSVSQSLDINPDIVKLAEFEPATMEEIYTIVKSHGIKCSPENVDTFVPFWLEILVNLSLHVSGMKCMVNRVVLPLINELGS